MASIILGNIFCGFCLKELKNYQGCGLVKVEKNMIETLLRGVTFFSSVNSNEIA